jgi:hypothetical protein
MGCRGAPGKGIVPTAETLQQESARSRTAAPPKAYPPENAQAPVLCGVATLESAGSRWRVRPPKGHAAGVARRTISQVRVGATLGDRGAKP